MFKFADRVQFGIFYHLSFFAQMTRIPLKPSPIMTHFRLTIFQSSAFFLADVRRRHREIRTVGTSPVIICPIYAYSKPARRFHPLQISV